MDVDELIRLRLVHEVHTSERRSFRACRRRWDWIFKQNYYPIMTAKPLEFGTAYHAAMEVLYNPLTWDWNRAVVKNLAITKFIDTCEEQRDAAIKATDRLALDDDVEIDYDERLALGVGMIKYYCDKVAPKEDVGWKPIKVEIEFMVPVANPETGEEFIWCKCSQCWTKWRESDLFKEWLDNADDVYSMDMTGISGPSEEIRIRTYWATFWQGLPVVYAGRIDMLAEDEDGNYWIFDWKTAARIAEAGRDEFLELDDQIGSYVWALNKMGLAVRGFIYHEQKKAFPQPPEPNKQIRLGRMFSVNKNQDVDWATYKLTVETQDTEAYKAGLYDEFLNYLWREGIVYYARHQIHKSAFQLQSIERNIGLEILDMLDPKLRIYPSPGRFGCGFCAFRIPCMEKDAGGDYQYGLDSLFERRQHYYIRSKPSTESKGGE